MLTLRVNGKSYQVDAEPATPLLWVLRDNLGLTGTKYGCGIAQCGSCTVHVNGRATRSCVLPVSAVLTSDITTIEGLSPDSQHPVQRAWIEHDVPQCGYCQSGQIMARSAGPPNWREANPGAPEEATPWLWITRSLDDSS